MTCVMLATSAACLAPADNAGVDSKRGENPATEDEKTLLNALGHDPASVDKLVERTGLTAKKVSSILLALEIDGHVLSAPGGVYSRATGIE